jgi:peptidoglycan/LPS O-acetylase OafA/YrhL
MPKEESALSLPIAIEKAEKRVQGIDLLRGLCILAVVLHHINLRIHFRESSLGQMLGRPGDRVLFWSGYYGVIVFFVISGFLITTWSLRRWGSLSQISPRKFYLLRFARIVPCLIGLLVILTILDRTGVPRFTINTQHSSLGRALLAALTFHVNWLEARTGYLPAAWDVLWSLSVEEVFYLFFPLLCTLVRKQALLIGLLCCFLVIGPFARVQTHNQLWADYGYLSNMDGIALGCIAAIVASKITLSDKKLLALRTTGALFCVFIIAFRGTVARLGLYKAGLDVTLLEIGAALLVIAFQQTFDSHAALRGSTIAANTRTGASRFASALFRSTACVRWFGRNSYEVYLTHMLVVWPMVMLFLHFRQSINIAPLWFLWTAVLAGAAGYAVARFYSEPFNQRLRETFLPAPKSAAMASD